MSTNQTRKTAVIAGAGPAGLTAAYELIKRTDIHPIVYEKTGDIGGISKTAVYKGNRIDLGGHRFYTKSQRVEEWWLSLLPLQAQDDFSDVEEKWSAIDDANREVEILLPPAKMSGNNEELQFNDAPRFSKAVKPAPHPELTDEVMLVRKRLSRIFFRRRFFPYPLSISPTVIIQLGIFNSIYIFLSYVYAKLFPISDEKYLDAFFINRFGKRLYETFFRAYTEKVWGIPCSQIKADWGAQRVKGLSLRKAVFQAIRDILPGRKKDYQRETSLIDRFFYPKFGPGQMWQVVANRITTAGSELNINQRISRLHIECNMVSSVSILDENGREGRTPCDYFFSSMPLKELINIISPAPPKEVLRIAEGLVYRDFMTVGLLFNKLNVQLNAARKFGGILPRKRQGDDPPLTEVPDNWIYIQDEIVRVGRIQIFNNWSSYMVDDPENTIWLGLEYFVDEGNDLWELSDAKMIDFGLSELETIGFARKRDFIDGCVKRMPKAYPAYFGTYGELSTIYDYANKIRNLYLIGRNGLHRYNNQDHSMMTAMLAVDLIASSKHDKTAIFECNIDSDYLEENPRSPTAPRI